VFGRWALHREARWGDSILSPLSVARVLEHASADADLSVGHRAFESVRNMGSGSTFRRSCDHEFMLLSFTTIEFISLQRGHRAQLGMGQGQVRCSSFSRMPHPGGSLVARSEDASLGPMLACLCRQVAYS